MGSQMPELEKLFDEWAEKHSKLLSQKAPYFIDHEPPFGRFVRDGVVNLDEWKKQKLRICFILPEASGFDNLEKHPADQVCNVAAEWNEKGAFTPIVQMIACWTKAVYDSTTAPVPFAKKSLLKQKNDLIRSIAVINIKKSDGQFKPDFKKLKNFAATDAEEIRKEIEIIKANIIVCCGNFNLLYGKRPEGETEDSKRTCVFYEDELVKGGARAYKWGKNKLVLSLWSVAQRYKPGSSRVVNYYAVREIARTGIKSFQSTTKKKAEPKKKKTQE